MSRGAATAAFLDGGRLGRGDPRAARRRCLGAPLRAARRWAAAPAILMDVPPEFGPAYRALPRRRRLAPRRRLQRARGPRRRSRDRARAARGSRRRPLRPALRRGARDARRRSMPPPSTCWPTSSACRRHPADWSPPPYDRAFLMREVGLVPEWYLPAATGVAPSPRARRRVRRPLRRGAGAGRRRPRRAGAARLPRREPALAARRGDGAARVGLLDFQDMLLGHPAYDLVSLLDDARRDVPDALRAGADRPLPRAHRCRPRRPSCFAAATLSAQRNLKILGLFTRLCRRDGKPRYLAYLPRVWAQPRARPLPSRPRPAAAFVDRHVPAPEPAVLARIGGT